LAKNSNPDPHGLTAAVLAEIPAKHARAALATCLPFLIRVMASEERTRAFSGTTEPPTTGKSWRQSAGEAWARILRQRVEVGEDERQWKFVADCTAGDLMRAAEFRRSLAARNLYRAEQLEQWATLLDDNGVATMGELPAHVLSGLAGAA
jgi:hypothetical protein